MDLKLIFCVLIGICIKFGTCDVVQTIDNSNQTNYLLVNKDGGHSTGVEVMNEAKQFSHYVESGDGVRLGCYGHQLNGKKYTIVYVSDTKGNRIIPSFTKEVPVYPKTGEVRYASFESVFDANEKFSGNIRDFFPDICRSSDEVPPSQPITTTPSPVTTPSTTTTPAPSPCPAITPTPPTTTTIKTTTTPRTTTTTTRRTTTPPPTPPPCPKPICNKRVSLMLSGLVPNCITLAINIPQGTLTQADLNKLNDIEVLNRVIDILTK